MLTDPVRRRPRSPDASSLASSYASAMRVAGSGAQIRLAPALHARARRAASNAPPALNPAPTRPRGKAAEALTDASSTVARGASPMIAANLGVGGADTS